MANNGGAERPKSPEELELEKQVALAKLRSDIAASDKAAFDAKKDQLKGPDVTVPTGKITSDGSFIESRILAQKTLNSACGQLAKLLAAHFTGNPINLVIYNATDIPLIELYAGIKAQVTDMLQQYTRSNERADRLLHPAPESAPPGREYIKESIVAGGPLMAGYAAAGVLRTAADLVSLFRTSTDFKNFDLTIDDTVLTATFRKALPAGWKLYHPGMFPLNTLMATDAVSEFMQLLNDVQTQRDAALSHLAGIDKKTKELTDELAAATDAGKKAAIQAALDEFAPAVAQLKTLNDSFAQLQAGLSAADATSKASTLTLLMRAERLIGKLGENNTYTIKLSAVSKGSNRVTENLWRNGSISHSAGTELSCLVFGPGGDIVFSDTQEHYTPYKSPEEIR